MKKYFPHYAQPDFKDCGPTCLKIVSKYYNKVISIQEFQNFFSDGEGCSGTSCSSDADCKKVCGAGTYGSYREYCATISCPTPGYQYAKQSLKVCSC